MRAVFLASVKLTWRSGPFMPLCSTNSRSHKILHVSRSSVERFSPKSVRETGPTCSHGICQIAPHDHWGVFRNMRTRDGVGRGIQSPQGLIKEELHGGSTGGLVPKWAGGEMEAWSWPALRLRRLPSPAHPHPHLYLYFTRPPENTTAGKQPNMKHWPTTETSYRNLFRVCLDS